MKSGLSRKWQQEINRSLYMNKYLLESFRMVMLLFSLTVLGNCADSGDRKHKKAIIVS
jgi:hypothetical protein